MRREWVQAIRGLWTDGGMAGLVVLWLKVEGITALGLPIVSILMLSVGLHEVRGAAPCAWHPVGARVGGR